MKRFFEGLNAIKIEGVKFGSSAGIFVSSGKTNFNDYYEHADLTLYKTKENGKNGYTMSFYDEINENHVKVS